MNRPIGNGIATAISVAFSLLPGTLLAAECGGHSGKVEVSYIGNDAERDKDWGTVYGKYVLRNGTNKQLEFNAYKGEAKPVILHPFAVEIEHMEGRRWQDAVAVLDHPEPPNEVVQVRPGDELTFLAGSMPDPDQPFRVKVWARNRCWATSEPFHFAPVSKSAGENKSR